LFQRVDLVELAWQRLPSMRGAVSNFPLAYKLTWLPRLLKPAIGGRKAGFAPAKARLLRPPPVRTRRLVFLGDISAVANREPPEIDRRLKNVIASADLVIGNCESPVVEKASYRWATAAGTRHAMTPRFLAETIAAIGAKPAKLFLSIANNHMLDQGVSGYDETKAALQALDVAPIGSADTPILTLELKGLVLGVAAFTEWRNAPAADFAGRVSMLGDLLADDCAQLRYAKADHLCVVAHWDREFRHVPRRATRELARDIAGGGAGLIVGHHAHVLQPAERLGDSLVAYGLGDFLGTVFPRVPWPLQLGGLLVADISADEATKGKVAAYAMVPFVRERLPKHERLVPLDAAAGELAQNMKRRFRQLFPAVATAR
jgi:poly-gamma-glutamate capsule biosynthesis protein CapA/YwtB (metallophosphatase superfamily)